MLKFHCFSSFTLKKLQLKERQQDIDQNALFKSKDEGSAVVMFDYDSSHYIDFHSFKKIRIVLFLLL